MPLKLTIKKTPHEKEWQARVTEDGKLVDGPYFANDKQDAHHTGTIMLKWAKMKETARKLSPADRARHVRVSTRDGHACKECFTCACAAIVYELGEPEDVETNDQV